MDRESHRAAVEAGYASLKDYVETWTYGYKFIGDLSKEDALLLQQFGEASSKILEFGAGGSTQIFAQCKPDVLISVETAPQWVEKTKNNIKRYKNVTEPVFVGYGSHPHHSYDLIFVDGVWDLREGFAKSTWPLLADNGVMIFHDTRRWFDAENVFKVAKIYWDEIRTIHLNHEDTNCTVIRKRQKVSYVNWNDTEGKPKWAYGIGDAPEGL